MSNPLDKLSYVAKLATDILFVKNPVGTSMGALFGVVFDGAITGAAPFFVPIQIIKSTGLGILHYMALGILGFNVKTWLKRDEVDPKIMEALDFIEEQVQQGRITRAQAKLKYNDLVAKVVDSVRLDPTTAKRLKEIAD